MRYDFNNMTTNGQLATKLGIDPRTLRTWAKNKFIPSYVNPANNYRYYSESEVLKALKLQGLSFSEILDEN